MEGPAKISSCCGSLHWTVFSSAASRSFVPSRVVDGVEGGKDVEACLLNLQV